MIPIHILLVDDRADNLLALEAVLDDPRYELIKAASGLEALEALTQREFALILLDVQMPVMDGYETARRIKADSRLRGIPIIFITAINKDPVHVFRGYDTGAIDYLTKPFDDFVLRSKVAVIANLYEKSWEIRRQQEALSAANEELQREIRDRQHAESALRIAHTELELRVRERTAALAASNDALQMEIAERRRAEQRLQESLREKELLLKEIHHRVKNNMQIVSSLLHLQADEIQDRRVLSLFLQSQARIRSMALVHEKLYQSRDLSRVDMDGYIHGLAEGLLQMFDRDGASVALQIRTKEAEFGIDTAIPCGLLLNELLSNALKHAFPSQRSGTIAVTLEPCGIDRFELVVSDDGIGLAADMELARVRSLGLRLVEALVQQIDGELQLDRQPGTTFRIRFPIHSRREQLVATG